VKLWWLSTHPYMRGEPMSVTQPSVLLITIDCLRAQNMGCYGYSRNTTPFIDSLASQGVLYNAFANGPFTAAAFPAILSSTYALDNGRYITLINRDIVSEILQKEGVKTAAIHSNPYLSSNFLYNRGFDYFEDFMNYQETQSKEMPFNISKILTGGNRMITRVLQHISPLKEAKSIIKNWISLREPPYVAADTITQCACTWIGETSPDPFFLWVHYMDLHEPYTILNTDIKQVYSCNISRLSQAALIHPKRKHRQALINVYDDKLLYVDQCIRTLCSCIKKNVRTPVIIITADHGQEFFEHGDFGHRAKYYDEILKIPLVAYGLSEKSCTGLQSQVNIPPSVLALYGIQPPVSYQGKPFWSGGKEFIISESSHNQKGFYMVGSPSFYPECTSFACRTKTWKYILQYKKEKLYNVKKDPSERQNVAAHHQKVVETFRKIRDIHNKNRAFKEKEKISESIHTLRARDQL
jgi:arylsulfatase A-like enzyme